LRVDGHEAGRPVAERDGQHATGFGSVQGGGVDSGEVAEHAGEGLVGSEKLDPSCSPDHAAATIAADGILGPQHCVADRDCDTVSVLGNPGYRCTN
jgi:hypothetical protein